MTNILIYFLSLVLSYLFMIFLAWWLCDIDPDKTYTWYSGIWHGLWFVPNLIRSWFGGAIYKAEHYTAAYNVWWWIFTIRSVWNIFSGSSSEKRRDY